MTPELCRFGVTGGRDFTDRSMVERALAKLPPDAVLVHGAATGADSLAASVWERRGGSTESHPAAWSAPCTDRCAPNHRRRGGEVSVGYCPAAGVYRNQAMLESGLDALVVFPGGRGTADMRRRAEAAGVPVVIAAESVSS